MAETPEKRGPGRPRGTTKPKEIHTDTSKIDVFHVDASQWVNVLSGLGTRRDKTIYTKFGQANIIDPDELTQLYLSEGLATRIVRSLPEDSTREWLYFLNDKVRKTLDKECARLNVESAFTEAGVQSQLQGGSIIIMGILDGRTIDQPVNEKDIRDIVYLRVVDSTCIDITSSEFDMNINSPTYGKVLKYKVRQQINNQYFEQIIHASRVLEFKSDAVPSQIYSGATPSVKYWGIPKLQSIYNTLSAHGSILQNISNILYEFNSGTYKLTNLAQLLSAGNEQLLYKRMQAIQAGTSTLNARILDKDEVYQKDYTSLASLDQLVGVYMLQLCGVANIPMVRLFGKSPSGFSSGEYDIKNYYDSVEVYQKNKLAPALRYFFKLIALKNKLDPDVEFEFNSLYQLTEIEKAGIAKTEAETEKLKAETASIIAGTETTYIDLGIRDAEKVAKEHGWGSEYTEIEPQAKVTTPPKAEK